MLAKLRDFIRPISVAALIGMLVLGALIAGALEAVLPGVGVSFTKGVAGWFTAIPEAFYSLCTVGLLGYTASRGAQKMISTYSNAKFSVGDRRALVDDPDKGE